MKTALQAIPKSVHRQFVTPKTYHLQSIVGSDPLLAGPLLPPQLKQPNTFTQPLGDLNMNEFHGVSLTLDLPKRANKIELELKACYDYGDTKEISSWDLEENVLTYVCFDYCSD